jgi:GST-like protein
LKISPNNKIPAIVDHEGPGGKELALFESGAILLYLAEKAGKLLPKDPAGRYRVIEWLMFQMASIGPMLGQAHHFRGYSAEKIPYAIDRYTNEARRLYHVLDRRLGDVEYVAGEYSIADIAIWPWLRSPDRQGVDLAEYPNVARWSAAIRERPAVQKGVTVPPRDEKQAPMDEKAKAFLFGEAQYKRR